MDAAELRNCGLPILPVSLTLVNGLQRGGAALLQLLPGQRHAHLPARHLQQAGCQHRYLAIGTGQQILRRHTQREEVTGIRCPWERHLPSCPGPEEKRLGAAAGPATRAAGNCWARGGKGSFCLGQAAAGLTRSAWHSSPICTSGGGTRHISSYRCRSSPACIGHPRL